MATTSAAAAVTSRARDARGGALGPARNASTRAVIALAAIVFLESVHLLQRRQGLRAFLSARPGWVRWPAYAAMVLLVLLLGKFKAQSFIYFQF